jgi:transposase
LSGLRVRSVRPPWQTPEADCRSADRAETDGAGDRGAGVPMSELRQDLRGLPPFARAYCHYTQGMERFVSVLSQWMSLAEVAAVSGLGWESVKTIVKSDLGKRYAHISLKNVKYLAVDELYIGRKGKFVTVVIDLESGEIVWVGKGRGEAALAKFFRRLRKSRARVKAVACDMAAAYWGAVLKHLPGVDVVFDHFHVIKMVNEKIDDLRRALQREADVLGRQYLKGKRYLLLAGVENVPENRIEDLAEALRFNQPLSTAYYLKEDLRMLWSQPTIGLMRKHLLSWCKRALASGITQMVAMAKTLLGHEPGILNYRKHPISTGKLEGINNKIRTLKRKAYGYRDEAFFILKLYSLHESKAVLTGV